MLVVDVDVDVRCLAIFCIQKCCINLMPTTGNIHVITYLFGFRSGLPKYCALPAPVIYYR